MHQRRRMGRETSELSCPSTVLIVGTTFAGAIHVGLYETCRWKR